MSDTTRLQVQLFLRSASIEDIEEVTESLNARRTVLDGEAKYRFKVGDPVKFDAGRRGIIRGTIDSFQRGGKVKVNAVGGRWTVSGSVLKPQ